MDTGQMLSETNRMLFVSLLGYPDEIIFAFPTRCVLNFLLYPSERLPSCGSLAIHFEGMLSGFLLFGAQ